MYGDLAANNISGDGVFVRRGRLESFIDGDRNRFTFNIRVSVDGKWLVSVRSFASIEVARIYADKDGVTILDRLGRTATIRSWNSLNREFGLSYEVLPMILGDVPYSRAMVRRRLDCGAEEPLDIGWANLVMTTDCDVFKASSMVIKENSFGNEVRIDGSGFRKTAEGKSYPTIIEVTERRESFNLKITLEDVETRWNGAVDFAIPAGYKIER